MTDLQGQTCSFVENTQQHVIQQINPDYFVDVSVIIGGDYSTLAALR